ncbi:MAG: hypothetical protein ABH983_02380, partial [Candidatus Micrarchaeota archaeon]
MKHAAKKPVVVIGGSGTGPKFQERAPAGAELIKYPTRWGLAEALMCEDPKSRRNLFIVDRHKKPERYGFLDLPESTRLPPHMVDFHSICLIPWLVGAEAVISTAAVGTMDVTKYPPGTLALGVHSTGHNIGAVTYFNEYPGEPIHADRSKSFSPDLNAHIARVAKDIHIPLLQGACVITTPGPQYEDPRQIQMIRSWRDVDTGEQLYHLVSMTNIREVILMAEINKVREMRGQPPILY